MRYSARIPTLSAISDRAPRWPSIETIWPTSCWARREGRLSSVMVPC
jgi:NADH:ubiquinone oxidoreductase subunit C